MNRSTSSGTRASVRAWAAAELRNALTSSWPSKRQVCWLPAPTAGFSTIGHPTEGATRGRSASVGTAAKSATGSAAAHSRRFMTYLFENDAATSTPIPCMPRCDRTYAALATLRSRGASTPSNGESPMSEYAAAITSSILDTSLTQCVLRDSGVQAGIFRFYDSGQSHIRPFGEDVHRLQPVRVYDERVLNIDLHLPSRPRGPACCTVTAQAPGDLLKIEHPQPLPCS